MNVKKLTPIAMKIDSLLKEERLDAGEAGLVLHVCFVKNLTHCLNIGALTKREILSILTSIKKEISALEKK